MKAKHWAVVAVLVASVIAFILGASSPRGARPQPPPGYSIWACAGKYEFRLSGYRSKDYRGYRQCCDAAWTYYTEVSRVSREVWVPVVSGEGEP